MTTRTLLGSEQLFQFLPGQPTSPGGPGDAVAEALELRDIRCGEPSIVEGRQHDGHLTVLSANSHRFPLNRVKNRSQPLLCFGKPIRSA